MVHLDLWKAMWTQENPELRPELCQTVLWTVPDYALKWARLRFELCQTALWTVPDCALNCSRLCFELCQTALWTVPDCALNCSRLCFELCQTALWTVPDRALNCFRLRFEQCQTALWTVPDCALSCARLRFELCQAEKIPQTDSDRQWSPDRWSNETESALANRLHTRVVKASQKLFAWGSEGVWLIRAKCSWKVSCGCAAEVMVGMI